MSTLVLFAEMNATSVLKIIHWVGVGFVFLWFLGSFMKDGLWDNAMRFFNAFIALCLGMPIAVIVAGLVGGVVNDANSPDPQIAAAVAIGVNWVSFLIWLAVLQTITENLSRVKVAFHPVVNGIGSFIFICGMTSVVSSYCWPIFDIVSQTK